MPLGLRYFFTPAPRWALPTSASARYLPLRKPAGQRVVRDHADPLLQALVLEIALEQAALHQIVVRLQALIARQALLLGRSWPPRRAAAPRSWRRRSRGACPP